MFGIGFSELLLIAVVTLLVVGPEKLPETIRSLSLKLARLKRMWNNAKTDLEREVGMDEIRRETHPPPVMENLERVRKMRLESLEDNGDTGLKRVAPDNRIQADTAPADSTPDTPSDSHVRRQESDAD